MHDSSIQSWSAMLFHYLCEGIYIIPELPGISLPVSLLATFIKITDRIFMKILSEMYLWTRKIIVGNFLAHSYLLNY